jgi:hypothetical protein
MPEGYAGLHGYRQQAAQLQAAESAKLAAEAEAASHGDKAAALRIRLLDKDTQLAVMQVILWLPAFEQELCLLHRWLHKLQTPFSFSLLSSVVAAMRHPLTLAVGHCIAPLCQASFISPLSSIGLP